MASFIHVSILVIVLLAVAVRADIPVHCVQPDITGLWRFHVGTLEGPGGPDSQCGYTAPDDPNGHQKLTPPNAPNNPEKGKYFLTDQFKTKFSLEVLLRDWTSRVVSVDAAGKKHFPEDVEKMTGGEWTMIYDEGFHVNLGGGKEGQHSFLAFSKYVLGKDDSAGSTDSMSNKAHSDCGHTLLGWYRQIDPATGAVKTEQCWWGERLKPLHEALATLPPSLAGAPVGLPPVLPLPTGQTPSLDGSPKGKPPKPAGSLPGPGALLRGATDSVDGLSSRPVIGLLGSVHTPTLRPVLQLSAAVSLALTIGAAYRSMCVGKEKGRFNSWHVIALVSLIVAVGMVIALFFGVTSHGHKRHTLERVAANSPVAKAAMEVPRHRKTTIGDAADRLHAGLQDARHNGRAVHWQSSPEKFKKWVRQRNEKHGMNVHESSTVTELLDAISPPRFVGATGFETSEVIGPVRAIAIKQQLEIANSMGKEPSQLTTEDVKDGWTTSDTNHHMQRTFTMNGKALRPDGWQTLPDFDWRNVSLQMPNGKSITNFVNAVPDQGGCGSCYAVAATSMLTSRLMLKYPELHEKFAADRGGDRISVEQQLNCNHFNQGCSGGYPYLISEWSFANDVVSDKCMKQSTSTTSSNATAADTCTRDFKGAACQERFRVQNWRYVGGSLGRCGLHHLCEDALREELYKGGPLAVSIEPSAGFGYSDGVYHGVAGMDDDGMMSQTPKKGNASCTDTECYIWRKVDHSVLLVGWGEDMTKGKTCQPRVHRVAETEAEIPDAGCGSIQDEEDCGKKSECIFRGFPYWIIQNSYGKDFGREGYLYFGPRGQDPMRVESMSMAADVTWVNRRVSHDTAEDRSSLSQTSFLSAASEHLDFGHSFNA